MSSVSSFEGSDKDSFLQRNFMDSNLRHSYLRKTDLLDTLDASRLRDTDAWSVAATIDDQESVISAHAPSIVSKNMDREVDDDRLTLDGETNVRDHLHDIQLTSNVKNSNNNNNNIGCHPITHSRIETLRDLVDNNRQHLLRSNASIDDEDDKRSRSNAAEFGDDGARSATADFDNSDSSDNEDHNNVVDDQIMAPPQPQPSFASVTKSYSELLEENEILQSQLRDSQEAQKHQEEMISNLRNLTNCDDELFEKALDLSQRNLEQHNSMEEDDKIIDENDNSGKRKSKKHYFESSPIVNARTLTQKLAQFAESLTRFVNLTVENENRLTFQQALFSNITEYYLNSLPFGTENQDLLNTAYYDQISRFHNTLGANFSKWYRRQTVQSLSLNLATKEYLQDIRNHLTDEMLRLVKNIAPNGPRMDLWDDILDLCASLSLEIHGGDADVLIQSISVGCKFNQDIMAVIGNVHNTQDNVVKMVISPVFIDEEGAVLLPARVVLE